MSIPDAFGARGLAFAAAYILIQFGRSLFMIWALGASPQLQRIVVWLTHAGIFGSLAASSATALALCSGRWRSPSSSPALGFCDRLPTFVPELHQCASRSICVPTATLVANANEV
jgi:hypothetical protein